MTQTNDKQALLERGGYFIASNAVMRQFLPAILGQPEIIITPSKPAKKGKAEPKPVKMRGADAKDAFILYFYLCSYVSGKERFSDGRPNPWYGWAWPNVDKIERDLHITRRRIKPLADLLVQFGLLEAMDTMRAGKRKKFYRPLHPTGIVESDEAEQPDVDVA